MNGKMVSTWRRDASSVAKTSFFSLLCGLLLVAGVSASDAGNEVDDLAAIRASVFDYFDGINTVDRERLERAFHPAAALKSVGDDGELEVLPIAEVIERWMQGSASQRVGKILSIEIAGDEIARVVFDYNGDYIDFLSLAKLQGQWRIIDKVFVRT